MKIIGKILLVFTILFGSSFQEIENNPKFTLIIFEGSDWCVNCNNFNKKVLSNDSFQNYLVNNHIEIVHVDFPQRKKQSKELKKQNQKIAEQYNFKGSFPTIIITQKEANSYQQIQYKSDVDAQTFIQQLDAFVK